jgi:hypothetical protein
MPLTITATEAGGFDLHEADEWYDGMVVAIEETEGQWGPGLKWIIELDGEVNDDNTPRETWAFCSQKLSPRSKLYQWLKGLNPAAIPEAGGTVDLEEFIGSRVQVMFERYDGFDQDGNSLEKEKVVKLRAGKPAEKKRVGKPAAAPVEDDEEVF